jgi:hypothetical protein
MSLVKTDEKTFVRDTKNMALLETNLTAKNDYISKKKLLIENRNLKTKMEKMENDIEILKNLMMGRN